MNMVILTPSWSQPDLYLAKSLECHFLNDNLIHLPYVFRLLYTHGVIMPEYELHKTVETRYMKLNIRRVDTKCVAGIALPVVKVFYCCHFCILSVSSDDKKRRIIAGWAIMLTCLGAILLTTGASNVGLPRCVAR